MPKSLSRKDNHRRSLLRNLATSLILYEEIKTTAAKAKELRPIVEHLLQISKKGDLVAKRQLLAYLTDKNAVKKVFEVLSLRYKKIPSGFVKIYKLGPRLGDNAPIVLIKLTPAKVEPEKESQEKNGKKNSGK